MSVFSPLLIICFDQDEAGGLSELARLLGYPDAHIVSGGVRGGIEALNLRTTTPEYILIDIAAHGSDIFSEIDELALHCDSSVRVAVIGGVNDIRFYRALRSRGIIEYFTRPAQAADVRAVLMQGPSARSTPSSSQPGTVISVMSAASGDGGSTLACNLAYCLAQEHKQQTVLVDMDYQFGLIASSLDVSAPFGIRELFEHPERGLDDILIAKMLVRYKENMGIISAPGELRLLPVIRPEVIRELIGVLRTQFKFVILDVPHIWTDWTAATLTYSDHIVMVGQLWLRSLTHVSRLLAAWNTIGIRREAVSMVINRSGAKFKEAISAQDFERISRQSIDAHLNNDVKAVVYAENQGKTLLETAQGPVLQQQIRSFAQSLLTRYGAADEPAAGKKGLRALFDKRSE